MTTASVVHIPLPTPFRVGPVNVCLITSEPVTLVDAGLNTDEAFAVLENAFLREGLALSDLQVVLLTHTHIDHIGLLGRLHEHASFTTYAHPDAAEHRLNCEKKHEEAQRFAFAIMRECGVPDEIVRAAAEEQQSYREYDTDAAVDHGLEEGAALGRFSVYHVPGHSALDMLFVDHEARIAFTGDHILVGTTPNPLLRRPKLGQPREKSLVQYRASLRKTHDLDIDICYPGHGDPIRNHRQVIEALWARQENRNARILELLGGRCMPVYEIARELFPRMNSKYVYLGISSAIGHLEVLEEEGKVASEHRDGILCFRRV